MNVESFKVVIACLVGGGIGALVALEIYQYLWWVGVLLGGLVGWLSYEPRKVLAACRKVFQDEEKIQVFRSEMLEWGRTIHKTLSMLCVMFVSGLSWILASNLIFWSVGITRFVILTSDITEWILFSTLVGAASFAIVIVMLQNFSPVKWKKIDHLDFSQQNRFILKHSNALYCLCYLLPKGVIFSVRSIPGLTRLLLKMAKRVFLLVHSELRLLCMTDSMIGAMTGYFLGSALVGAVAGAIFGLVNYELVSKRWLKLVPQRS